MRIMLAALVLVAASCRPWRRSRRRQRRDGPGRRRRKRPTPTARRRCTGLSTTTTSQLVDRLIRAGADVNAKNDYGATPMSEAAIIGDVAVIETSARGRRGRRVAECRRPDRTDDRRAHEQRGGGAVCSFARRQRQRGREVARADGADVGRRAAPAADGEGTGGRRRRRERALDRQRVGAAGQRRTARQVPSRGRLHAAALCGARRLRRVRAVLSSRAAPTSTWPIRTR